MVFYRRRRHEEPIMRFLGQKNPRLLLLASGFAFAMLVLVSCGGGGSSYNPLPKANGSAAPQTGAYSGPLSASGMTINLPSVAGFAETLTVPANDAVPGTNLTVRVTNSAPAAMPGLAPDMHVAIPFLYFTIGANKDVKLNGFPGFKMTIPAGFSMGNLPVKVGYYDPVTGWKHVGDFTLTGRTATFTPTSTAVTLKANLTYYAITYTCGGPSPSPAPSPVCTTVPLVAGTPLPIPALGGYSGDWVAGANNAPEGTTVTVTSYISPPPGAPSPVADRWHPLFVNPPVKRHFVTIKYGGPSGSSKRTASSSSITFGKFPAVQFDLPSSLTTKGMTFKLETFDLTTGALLDTETGTLISTSHSVSFPGTNTSFTADTSHTYLWELITTTYVPGTFTEYPLPASSFPTQIVEGPDGNLWFTEQGTDKIGRMTPSGTLTEFPIPNSNVMPYGITNGPDGNLWFTNFPAGDATAGAIGRITTAGVITLFSAPGLHVPLGITAGPDKNLWFVDAGSQAIGFSTTSGSITEFALTPNPASALRGITTGPDNNLWFTDPGNNMIGKITTSGTSTEYAAAAGSQPFGILARSGSLLFGETGAANIGQSTTAGSITEISGPVGSTPALLARDALGDVWFSDSGLNALGKLVGSLITETSPIPTANASPDGITVGPGGTIWFTEFKADKIGVFTPS